MPKTTRKPDDGSDASAELAHENERKIAHDDAAGDDLDLDDELAPLNLVPRTDEDVCRLVQFAALQPALLARHQRDRRRASAAVRRNTLRRSARQVQREQQQPC